MLTVCKALTPACQPSSRFNHHLIVPMPSYACQLCSVSSVEYAAETTCSDQLQSTAESSMGRSPTPCLPSSALWTRCTEHGWYPASESAHVHNSQQGGQKEYFLSPYTHFFTHSHPPAHTQRHAHSSTRTGMHRNLCSCSFLRSKPHKDLDGQLVDMWHEHLHELSL